MGPATKLRDYLKNTKGHHMISEPSWQLLTHAAPIHPQLYCRWTAVFTAHSSAPAFGGSPASTYPFQIQLLTHASPKLGTGAKKITKN